MNRGEPARELRNPQSNDTPAGMLTAREILGFGGPFARSVPGFTPRRSQQEMAEAIANAIDQNTILIAEAGTGTGKTFAYLVPALLSGRKIVISTGTKTLQDQLFHRDLPVVRDALPVPITVALLKGRANYLCLHRLERTETEGRFHSREQAGDLRVIRRWGRRTQSGDIAECDEVSENAAIWPLVTSTVDNCLGQECPQHSDCFVMKARRSAQESDVVVINHHLLCADMALKEEGFGDLLPGADAFILDEAHQLPEIASMFFGVSLTGGQLLDLTQDILAAQVSEAGDDVGLAKTANNLEKATRDLRLAFGIAPRRGPWHELGHDAEVQGGLSRLCTSIAELLHQLDGVAQRGKELENCRQRCIKLQERLMTFLDSASDEQVQWYETFTHSFSLNLTPLDVGAPFRTHIERYQSAWVFTSATLAVGESFEHFCSSMGVDDAVAVRWDSPFDYAHNALLYIPCELPLPADPAYTRAVVDASLPVIEASSGGAFMLFTSHRALKEAAAYLQGKTSYPLLVQGTAPRADLLNRFRALGNAILLGCSSFWEGVDVRGSALSCVIIDKLPFSSPDDPVLQARLHAVRNRGGEPFRACQLPEAVISLKQGAGRLIRDESDRGVLVVCDPRLISKSYGRIFIKSLPNMPLTRDLAAVRGFFLPEQQSGSIPQNELLEEA